MSHRYRLYVGNIPARSHPDYIEDLFEEYGRFRDASDAVYELHGHIIHGIPLKVEWAQKKKRYKVNHSIKYKSPRSTPECHRHRSVSLSTISTPSDEIIEQTKQKLNRKYVNNNISLSSLQNNQTTIRKPLTIDQFIDIQTAHVDPIAYIKFQIFELLLLVINGTEYEKQLSTRTISNKIYSWGARLLFECIIQLFMFP
eukprot:154165_1